MLDRTQYQQIHNLKGLGLGSGPKKLYWDIPDYNQSSQDDCSGFTRQIQAPGTGGSLVKESAELIKSAVTLSNSLLFTLLRNHQTCPTESHIFITYSTIDENHPLLSHIYCYDAF